ncbi:hypothetical protein CBR_g17809 [Chara braunii]|uniref:Uncharacterized protein n=1 Tax=Chara braunii TaxID=69332 RepID=A0A388KVR9_CHABU|nr:hypothetical protein CBR_g17809 [Chara braunii]|eukprot:GBG74098.1 hypothetical protein CBR_g17809 [Chara braunii]
MPSRGAWLQYAERVEGVMAADDLRHYMEAEGGKEEERTTPETPSRAGGADASLTGGADGGDTCGGTINLDDDLDAARQRGGGSRSGTQPAGFQDAPPVDDGFWSGERTVINAMGPVYAFLGDLDRDGSSPTGLWDLEAILRQRLRSLRLSDFDRDVVMTIVRDRCAMMRQRAHAAAYLLDPRRRDISLLEDRSRSVVKSALEHFARILLSASKRMDGRYVDIWADQVEEEEVALDEDDAIPADVPQEEAEAIERSNRRKEGRNRAGKGKAPAVDSKDEEDDMFDDLVWMHQGIRNEAEAKRGAGMILPEDQHDLLDELGGHDPHDDFDAYVGGTMHTVVSMRKRVGGEVDMEELLARTGVVDPSSVAPATHTSQPPMEHGVDTDTQAERERRVPQRPEVPRHERDKHRVEQLPRQVVVEQVAHQFAEAEHASQIISQSVGLLGSLRPHAATGSRAVVQSCEQRVQERVDPGAPSTLQHEPLERRHRPGLEQRVEQTADRTVHNTADDRSECRVEPRVEQRAGQRVEQRVDQRMRDVVEVTVDVTLDQARDRRMEEITRGRPVIATLARASSATM